MKRFNVLMVHSQIWEGDSLMSKALCFYARCHLLISNTAVADLYLFCYITCGLILGWGDSPRALPASGK